MRVSKSNRMGQVLKNARKRLGMTLDALVAETQCGKGNLSDLESGKSKNPTLSTLRALSKALGITVSEIIGDE